MKSGPGGLIQSGITDDARKLFPSLDATATDPGFAAFGHVVEGMDVAKAILAAPVSPNGGRAR